MNGTVTTFAGNGTAGFANGPRSVAMFNTPLDVSVLSNGTVIVVDYTNNRIRAVSPTGEVSTLAGSGTAGSADGTGASATFNQPRSVVVCNDIIYVADRISAKIRKITYSVWACLHPGWKRNYGLCRWTRKHSHV